MWHRRVKPRRWRQQISNPVFISLSPFYLKFKIQCGLSMLPNVSSEETFDRDDSVGLFYLPPRHQYSTSWMVIVALLDLWQSFRVDLWICTKEGKKLEKQFHSRLNSDQSQKLFSTAKKSWVANSFFSSHLKSLNLFNCFDQKHFFWRDGGLEFFCREQSQNKVFWRKE